MKPRVVAVCDSAHPPASTAGQPQPGRYPHAPPDSTVAAASAPAAIHRGQARACCTSSGGQRTSTSGSNRRATKVRMEQQASLPPAAQLPCVAAQRQPCSVLLCVHAQRACGERAQHACTAARLHALTGPQQRLASVVPALAGCCRGARHDTDRHLQPSPSALPCLAATAACTGRPRPDPGGRAGLRRSSQPPGPGPARPRGTCAARAGRLRPSPAARAAARAAPARAAARSAARGRPAGTRRRPGRARRRPRAGCAAGRTPHPAARRAARLRATARGPAAQRAGGGGARCRSGSVRAARGITNPMPARSGAWPVLLWAARLRACRQGACRHRGTSHDVCASEAMHVWRSCCLMLHKAGVCPAQPPLTVFPDGGMVRGQAGAAPSCGASAASPPNTLTSSLATYRNALCRVAANQRGSALASAGTSPAAAAPWRTARLRLARVARQKL